VIDESVLIGGREHREIVIVDYQDSWPGDFERERDRITAALGSRALAVEHVGSTAVPGLAAKPIIDVLVTVEHPGNQALAAPLRDAGYELRVREPGHRMFRTAALDVHVHVWAAGDPEVERLLRFRDRLRESAEDRVAYERLKRDLAQRNWSDMNEYADAKGPLIEAILARSSATPPSTL
jgi:GrpB-like predicted nucleotidyltransferase (UPF0157 family)